MVENFLEDYVRTTPVFDKARLDPDRGRRTAQELENAIVELETLLLRFGLLEKV